MLQKLMFAGLGAAALAREEGARLYGALVEKGQGVDPGTHRVAARLRTAADEAAAALARARARAEESVSTVLQRANIPSEREIAALNVKVEVLGVVVEKLRAARQKAARKAAP